MVLQGYSEAVIHLCKNDETLYQFTPIYYYLHTNTRLNTFSITEKDIIAIIKLLDPNESHG